MNKYITIKEELLLDDNLKPQEVYLFLQLVRLCDEAGQLNISAAELMKETRFTNKGLLLGYLKTLIDQSYIKRLDNIDKKAVYQIDCEMYFKR